MPKERMLCPCKKVTTADVDRALSKGAKDFKAVKKMTGAGSKCGKCKNGVKKYIEQQVHTTPKQGNLKTIGLLGGMSWESTAEYYRLINQGVREKLGGLHSARLVLYSVEFDEIERCQQADDWNKAADILSKAAKKVQKAGADFLLLCTNTMHKVAPQIQKHIDIPLLHIADATAHRLQAAGVQKVALLGTKYTMEQGFYKDRLVAAGLEVLVPEEGDRDTVHRIIFDELCLGIVANESKEAFLAIIHKLKEQGAEAVILGCTEIGLLIIQEDSPLPVYDTTRIHAEEAVRQALGD